MLKLNSSVKESVEASHPGVTPIPVQPRTDKRNSTILECPECTSTWDVSSRVSSTSRGIRVDRAAKRPMHPAE